MRNKLSGRNKPRKTTYTPKEIQSWLISQVSERLEIEPEDIDIRGPFTDLGLSSREAVVISGDLEVWLGCQLSPTLLYEYPTIAAISKYLAQGPDSLQENGVTAKIPKSESEEIAVIGIGCRFPGANGPDAFWQLLRNGGDAITEIPPDRWDLEYFYDPDPEKPGKMNTRWGGFLEHIGQFDAHFFGISPREAAQMDPQQRLLLEVSWEALEDAGQVKERLEGSKTGIFVGISTNEYSRFQGSDPKLIDAYLGTGNALSIAANRLSYFFNFRGPSIAVDTACSSSLLAIHLACRSLSSGEADLALAGGANLILSPEITINFSKAGFMAPDGRCKAFDARANGYVRGEGVGIVVLKPLFNALDNGDPIYAVIRGSATNQDGRSNGLTAPNQQAQEEVLREAFGRAGVSPGQIQYIETHGTGTALGDSIEAKALGTVLADHRPSGQPCIIGSVKTNIGHLEAAAGIAGLIKVALSLKNRIIPTSLHFQEPNPHISFDELQLRVQQQPGPWPGTSRLALAGVSSFGFGGTNAHVVLEEAPRVSTIHQQEEITSGGAYFLPISAHSPKARQAMAKAYRDFLSGERSSAVGSLYDICYTASRRRQHHDYRLALVDHSREKLCQHLEAFSRGETRLPGLSCGRKPLKGRQKLVFVFSGQGSQWPGMGRELLNRQPVFRETLRQCDREIQRQANWSLWAELTADEAHCRLAEIDVLQPVLFSIQVALAALWQSWGIKPDAVVGYSLGEIAAAHVSGALNLEEAVRVICSRSRLLKQIKGRGSLAVVELSLEKAQQALSRWDNRVSIAASSSPTITVLSGEPEALQEVLAALKNQGIFCVSREEDVAVHTHQLEPLCEDLFLALAGLRCRASSIPFYSTVTGKRGEGLVFDAAYWVRNLREPVLFSAAVQQMLADGCEIFLEISPHPILSSSVQEWLQVLHKKGKVLPSLRRKRGEGEVILDSLGALYTLGLEVNWGEIYRQSGRCLRLPPYTWQRERYWVETGKSGRSGEELISTTKEPPGDWLYEVKWKPKARVEPDQAQGRPQPDLPGSWLIFSDRGGLAISLTGLLQEQGEPYVMVFPGKAYESSKQGHFKINPTHPGDFHRLIKEAYGDGESQPPCRGIVHLWSLDTAPPEETTAASLKTDQPLICGSVLHLCQALAAAGLAGSPRLWLVTRGAQPVGSETAPLSVAQAPLWGLGSVIALEHPEFHSVRVDLDPLGDNDDPRVLFEEIWLPDQDQEDQVAFRRGVRYVPRLVFHDSRPSGAAAFRPDGTYLITGGLGGLGLKVAQWMVEQGARHLALMGRRDASKATQEILDTLSKAGARAVVFKADVSREKQVAGVLAEISQSMPPLRGIIHAAGVLEDGMLMQQKWKNFARVMASKVEGAWLLHTLTLDMPLDFFILFSSAISLLGSIGVGNYAAANAFLDALSHHRRNRGLPTLSINWGPWAEVGMAAGLGSRGMRQWAAAGIGMIAPGQGLRVLGQILGQSAAQITILPINWSEFIRQFSIRKSPPPLFSEVIRRLNLEIKDDRVLKPQLELLRRLEDAAPGERRNILSDYLQDQVAKVLQLDPSDPVEPQRGLFDMGMDSHMAIELKNRIETGLGFTLPSVLTFNYSTIESLVEYLDSKMLPPESPEKAGEIITSFDEISQPKPESIAIIGLACRFPGGANDLETFWQLLHDGVDAITEVPSDRWDADAFYDPDPDTPGKTYVKWGGFLDQVDRFDARFFGISPREAVSMDPQQRLLLEVSWEALEDAGQLRDNRADSQTGVFIGLANNDYLRIQVKDNDLNRIDVYTGTGTAACITSGRLSYILRLQGPNLTLDTACSSSLVAIHLACQSLRSRECGMALAGGVSLILTPESIIYFSRLRALSLEGRCKTFDAAADGYVQGEGCGVVVLKRLSDAEADGDNILALIRGSAINHDGRSSGLTVPNGLAQQAVIGEALARAGVEPTQVSYVEAHGTGTSLGDPIEVQALAAVLGEGRSKDQPLKIGSVKTNIGHLEAAAGVAGLIKVVLAMQHEKIPSHLHFKEPNHHIPWEEIPIVVQAGQTPWPSAGGRRIAGVSSFGISGTNAHVVLEEAPRVSTIHQQEEITSGGAYFLPISAHSPKARQAMAKAYRDFLSGERSSAVGSLYDICYTASRRRQHHDYRLALVDHSREKLCQHLEAFSRGETRLPGLSCGRKPLKGRQKLVFVFSGQGSQWPGMGRELLNRQPVFRETLRQCDREIQRQANWSLWAELTADEAHCRLAEIDVLQPVLFSIQVALAALWQSWGIKPDAVVGYSLGEIAAAHVSGALNLEEAVRVICSRSRLLKQIKGRGSLAVVELSLEKAQQALSRWDNRVSIAASSSPTITVLSGEPEALQEVLAALKNQGIFCVSREEDVAVHTHQLEPLCEDLFLALAGLRCRASSIPFYSTVTGKRGEGLVFDAAYWVRNLREPVLFSAAVQQMLADGCEIFLEISPHPILSSSVQEWLQVLHKKGKVLPSLRRKRGEGEVILDSLGALYTLGLEVNWGEIYRQSGRCLRLPPYTWQRERYWVETGKSGRSGEELISTTKEPPGDWLYEVKWKPKARVEPDQAQGRPQPDLPGSWLIFSDRGGLAISLTGLLQEQGEPYVMVFPGKAYESSKQGHFKINPTHPGDFHRLIKEAYGDGESQPPCRGIVHLWSLDTAPPEETTAASLKTDQPLICGSVLHLCQALAAAGLAGSPRLWLVTRGAQPVGSETAPLSVAQAPLWGLGSVIALEHPEFHSVRVDLDPLGDNDDPRVLFEEIWLPDQDQEDQVAFRRGVRYVPRLDFHDSRPSGAAAFRPDGTYLITGGLGGLGLTVAGWMVNRGARHLVLVGRSEASAAAQEALKAMGRRNAQVVAVRADVTREEQVAGVLAEISQSMPPLKGIIHAAGVFDRVMLLHQEWEPFAKVLAPKVEGAWNLHALTRHIPLDFFVLFSSAASLLGGNSQGDYAAANAFLDALAHYRRDQRLPALSVNWGPWADVGMASAVASRYQQQMTAIGVDFITPEQGLQMLEQVLRQDSAQVMALPGKYLEFVQQFNIDNTPSPLLSELMGQGESGVKARQPPIQQTELLQRIKAASPGERRDLLFAHIKDQVVKVLQLEPSHPVEPQQGLFDMGMDSLMAIELKNRIETSLGLPLPSVLTFNYSTIESLAEHLESKMLPPESPGKAGERSTNLDEIKHSKTGPIAIIGMSCRFPGNANDPEAFWSLLKDGVDAVTEVPADRWDADAFYDPDPDTPGKMNTKWGAFLEEAYGFDAGFFGISPREAVDMDPQQRILLEVTWEALENAGQIKDKRGDSQTGIFIGLTNNDYLRLQANLNDLNGINAYSGTGTAACITSGRLAHILGLQGPNLTFDTACSSSLVAVHLASQSLRNGECDLALAGGVNLIMVPEVTIYCSRIHMMAGDGRCKTFDAAADGYVRGEGCGVVVLKRLDEALTDGENILAIIRGSAINHDGHTSGLTVPNGLAQEAVIRKALDNAGINPAQVSYVEAHGTGTSLGDPIEVQALAAVLGKGHSKEHPLVVGSVKTNIGHLEATAGAASLIKVVLAMNHNEIPPHLHLKTPNPHIKWDEIPVEVPTRSIPWPSTDEPRLAGVSSFGFSGTNAHVVLEEAPRVPQVEQQEELPANGAYLLPISAHNPEALQCAAKDYHEFLNANGSKTAISLPDICCTASLRRNHHHHRLALVGNSKEELINQLKAFLQGESSAGLYAGKKSQDRRRKLVFVFPGQGNQWPGMGLKLMGREPVFRETLQQCDRLLGHYADWSLLEILKADDKESRLQDTEVAQPAIFALQTALASLWKSWDIVPDAVVGHSIGELAAAHTAGVLSLEDAVRIVYYRGKLMEKTAGLGKMAAVGLSREETVHRLGKYMDRLSVAAVNSPVSTTLSGDPAVVEEIHKVLQEKEIFSRLLKVNYAFHSPQLDTARDELVQALQGLQPQPASLPIFSTVTGKNSEDLSFDARYWGQNMREPVLFSAAIQQLLAGGYDIFLELSPHPTLIHSVKEGLNVLSKEGVVLPSLHREKDEGAVLLDSLGSLYSLGYAPDWRKLYPSGGRFVQLPAYPWQRNRYWLEAGAVNRRFYRERTQGNRMEPLKSTDTLPGNVDDWFYKLHWQPEPLSNREQEPGALLRTGEGRWLIFTDSSGIGKILARRLVKQGERCILVSPGDAYKRTYKAKDREYFRVHPGRGEDFQQLLKNTIGPGQPGCAGIIHLWGLDADSAGATTAASLEMAQTLGSTSILHLVRELTAAGLQVFPRMWLVSRGVQPVEESHGPLTVAGAPIWGFGGVMAVEHPELWGGLVDLDPAESKEKCSLHLLECVKNPDGEGQLAFRKGERYAARVIRNREAAVPSRPMCWRPDGTYLVTGGLGDLGLRVARWMVEQGARRLILLGRTRLPRRSQWGKVEKKSRLAHQIDCIRELEAVGASVHLAAVDVADEKQLTSFLKKFRNEHWPPIRGVMHAAGVVQVKPLVMTGVEDLTAVFRPKVLGGWLLHCLLKDAPLDFFVLFSSAASLVNPPMLSSYAAANTFLDILAHHRRALGQPALSINWGAWSEVGMMARHQQAAGRDAMPRGMDSFTPQQGVDVLGRLLGQDAVQIGVMPFDWQQFFRSYPAASRSPLLTHMVREAAPLSGEDPGEKGRLSLDTLLEAQAEDRKTLLESYLRDRLAIILQLPAARVDVHQSILELGIDSLTSIELQNRLKADFGLSIPVTAFLQGHSLARLAAQVLDQLPGEEPIPTAVTPTAPETVRQLLANIDKLSDEEVDKLLKEISAAEEDKQ